MSITTLTASADDWDGRDLENQLRAALADPDTIGAEAEIAALQAVIELRETPAVTGELDQLAANIRRDLNQAWPAPKMPGPQFNWRTWLDGDDRRAGS